MMTNLLMATTETGISAGLWVLIGILVLIGLIFLILFGPLFSLWLQALAAHAGVGIFQMIGMRLRKVNPRIIVLSRIQAVRAERGTDGNRSSLVLEWSTGTDRVLLP